MPLLSIVVVNWNTRELLRACIRSIYATLDPISFEVIVVDNASDDGSAEMVSSDFPEVLLVRNDENVGFAAANNIGLRRASGEFVMLLNPDTELCPGSVARMLDFIKSRPDVGMVGPKLVCADGALQINGQRFPTFLREVMCLTRLSRVFRRYHDSRLAWCREDFDINAEVDALAGACMLVRKTVADGVGLLDESFFLYYEDTDWCCRIKKAGWKIWYLGEAVIIHVCAQSAHRYGIHNANKELHRAQYLYWRKHGKAWQAVTLRVLSYFLLAVQSAKRTVRTARERLKGGRRK
ncbi:MAG: glycosyltransferase family 2 protein [Armatimonadetes bacterium]|nr:glycosyltransferase family 2 protein [Armatimonadota bacterium]